MLYPLLYPLDIQQFPSTRWKRRACPARTKGLDQSWSFSEAAKASARACMLQGVLVYKPMIDW